MKHQPDWITEQLSPANIAAINQGGCASGAYMPAVTYHTALRTMNEHGNDVLEFLDDDVDHLTLNEQTWSGIAVLFLSAAVEKWCYTNDHLADWEDDNEDQ